MGNKKLDGSGTVIAILDTAIDDTCFTTEQKLSYIKFMDCLKKTPVSSRDHGTICSAVAVGSSCVRGVAPGAALVVYRIADKGIYDVDATLEALRHIKENALMKGGIKVDVVSISFYLNEIYKDAIYREIKELTDMGVTFVAAAGNRGLYQGRASIPARFDNVISVGALDGNGKWAPYTPRVEVDVYAPGMFPAGYKGTSLAAPAVAGLVLLLKQWANFIGSPAKENINLLDVLRKIFREDMFMESDSTEELVEISQPTVKKDSCGKISIFQPVDFFMNMKDQPERLNVIVQKHLDDIQRMEL